MMDFSERSEYVGANVKPEIKRTLQDHIKGLRESGNPISMSRWIEESIRMRLEKEGIAILSIDEEYVGEALPFEESL